MSITSGTEPILLTSNGHYTLSGTPRAPMREVSDSSVKVALIDTRTLLGELLVEALQLVDKKAEYALFPSVPSWLATMDGEASHVVLLSADPQPGRTPQACTTDLQMTRKMAPTTPVIILSSAEDPDAVHSALEMGVGGYVCTNLHVQAMVQIIHLVQSGGHYVPTASFQALMRRSGASVEEQPARQTLLSAREALVAKALRKGTPNKVIAYELNMCESTVKVHVRHIMRKLKAKNRTQVAFLTNAMFDD